MKFLRKGLNHSDIRPKHYIIAIDQVYIKSALCYWRNTMFGKAVNNPNKLDPAVPVTKLGTEFQFEHCQPATETIRKVENVKALGILPDGNRAN